MAELSCREFIEFLDEYVADAQPQRVRAAFERHMEDCPECMDYLKTYRDTISLTRKACAEDPKSDPPVEAPESLIQAILQSRLEDRP